MNERFLWPIIVSWEYSFNEKLKLEIHIFIWNWFSFASIQNTIWKNLPFYHKSDLMWPCVRFASNCVSYAKQNWKVKGLIIWQIIIWFAYWNIRRKFSLSVRLMCFDVIRRSSHLPIERIVLHVQHVHLYICIVYFSNLNMVHLFISKYLSHIEVFGNPWCPT